MQSMRNISVQITHALNTSPSARRGSDSLGMILTFIKEKSSLGTRYEIALR